MKVICTVWDLCCRLKFGPELGSFNILSESFQEPQNCDGFIQCISKEGRMNVKKWVERTCTILYWCRVGIFSNPVLLYLVLSIFFIKHASIGQKLTVKDLNSHFQWYKVDEYVFQLNTLLYANFFLQLINVSAEQRGAGCFPVA